MATLQVESNLPQILPAESLAGWRREFCVQLLGEGAARIFVRAVEGSSFKAAELRRAILFHRVDGRFSQLEECVGHLRPDLERLAESARLARADKDNLFATVAYDRASWERVQRAVDRWARR